MTEQIDKIKPITPRRDDKFKRVAAQRQMNLTVVLENVHDPHNISAVLRTCDSIGIDEIYVLYSEGSKSSLKLGKKSSKGSRKWVKVHLYDDAEACFKVVKEKYGLIVGTHLNESAKSIYQVDYTGSCAIVFGNEHDGLSEIAKQYLDTNIIIPQVGMSESLNISVACAVTLYEVYRQRSEKNAYIENETQSADEQANLYKSYIERARIKGFNSVVYLKE